MRILRNLAVLRGRLLHAGAKRSLGDAHGSAAVEFALVVFPFLMLCMGMIQFLCLHYTQQLLSDALYSTASLPEAELLAGNKSGYVTKLCAKVVFQSKCLDAATGIKVELMRLSELPTTTTDIAGETFNAGSTQDVLVLRATMPAPRVAFFIPELIAKDSVVFRR